MCNRIFRTRIRSVFSCVSFLRLEFVVNNLKCRFFDIEDLSDLDFRKIFLKVKIVPRVLLIAFVMIPNRT